MFADKKQTTGLTSEMTGKQKESITRTTFVGSVKKDKHEYTINRTPRNRKDLGYETNYRTL